MTTETPDLDDIRARADAVHRENASIGDRAITALVVDVWALVDEVERLRTDVEYWQSEATRTY